MQVSPGGGCRCPLVVGAFADIADSRQSKVGVEGGGTELRRLSLGEKLLKKVRGPVKLDPYCQKVGDRQM